MWQTISIKETSERLKTNTVNGLTKEEVEEKIKKYGENKLTEKKKESILVKFLKQFNDNYTNNCGCNICCNVKSRRF